MENCFCAGALTHWPVDTVNTPLLLEQQTGEWKRTVVWPNKQTADVA